MKNSFKRLLSLVLTLSMITALTVMLAMPASATAEIWDGTADTSWYNAADTEFTLTTAEQLAGLASIVNAGTDSFTGKTVNLGADLYLNDPALMASNFSNASNGVLNRWTRIGSTAANSFKGIFDGKGYTVYGMWYLLDNTATSSGNGHGLFGFVGAGEIKNLTVRDSYLYVSTWTRSYISILAGDCSGNITNCNVYDSTIYSTQANTRTVGAIVGGMRSIMISGCRVENFNVYCTSTGGPVGLIVGGTAGDAMISKVSDCVALNCSVMQTFGGKGNGSVLTVGGICGNINYASYITIKDCYVLGAELNAGSSLGGFVGGTGSNPYVYIDGCVFTGSLSINGRDQNPVKVLSKDPQDKSQLKYTNNNEIMTETTYFSSVGGAVGMYGCSSSSARLTVVNCSVSADITVKIASAISMGANVPLNKAYYKVNAGGMIGTFDVSQNANFSNNKINVSISDLTPQSVYDNTQSELNTKVSDLRANLSTLCGALTLKDGTTPLIDHVQNTLLQTPPVMSVQKSFAAICGEAKRNAVFYMMNNIITGAAGTGVDNMGVLFGTSILSDANTKVANTYCLNSFAANPDVAAAPAKDYGTQKITAVTEEVIDALNTRTLLAAVKAMDNTKTELIPTYKDWTLGADMKLVAASVTMTDELAVNFYAEQVPTIYPVTVEVNGAELIGTEASAESEDMVKFTVSGINAADMDRELNVTVKLGDAAAQHLSYSVLKYAANMYAKETVAADMKALIVGMMYYGDAAQAAGGETATLMDAFETATGYTASATYVADGYTALALNAAAGVTPGVITSAALTADGNVQVVIRVADPAAETATVTFLGETYEYAVTDGEFVTDCLYATSLNSVFTVTVGEATTEYSVSNYIVSGIEGEVLSAEQKTLARAMAVYMDLVSEYANSIYAE